MTPPRWFLTLIVCYGILLCLALGVMLGGVLREYLLEPALPRPWYFLALPLLSGSALVVAGMLTWKLWHHQRAASGR